MFILNFIAEMLGGLTGIPYFMAITGAIILNIFLWKGEFEDATNNNR